MNNILLFTWAVIMVVEFAKLGFPEIYRMSTKSIIPLTRLLSMRRRQVRVATNIYHEMIAMEKLNKVVNYAIWKIVWIIFTLLYWLVIIISIFNSVFWPLSVAILTIALLIILIGKPINRTTFIIDAVFSGTIIATYLFYLLN